MDVSLCGVDFFVWKIEMGEENNQNYIGPSPHDFCVNLHQNKPQKLVVLWPVWVLMVD